MGTTFNSIDAFLGHKSSISGGSKFVKGWKEKGKLYAWLHTQQLPIGLWRHGFPMLVVRENKETGEVKKHVWNQSINCHEDESTLLRQNFRDKNTGEREVMPTRCPLCRFIEHIHQKVRTGELKWTDAILRYDGADDPKENLVLHAGGVYNGFADYNGKLTDAQKEDLKRNKIFPSEAWKENCKAGLSYVFTMVDNDKVSDGVVITIEKSSLGDRVKDCINDTIESLGVEAGNPTINPYCIEFIYDEKAQLQKKYSARRIERIKLTPEIEALIRSDPPDLTGVLKPFALKEFRAQLEKHLVVDVDLDWIFDVETETEEYETDSGEDEDTDLVPASEPVQKAAPPAPKSTPKVEAKAQPAEAPKTGGRKPKVAPPADEPGDPCDNCGAAMTKKQTKCSKCGTEYESVDEDPAPAPAGAKKGGVPF